MSTEIEVIEPLDVAAATRLDKRIRLMASTVRENLTKIAELVEQAKAGQVHVALGFSSWTAYLADAIGGQIELGTESRRAVVELLAGEGMSNRAIAATVGVSHPTVAADLAAAAQVVSDLPPDGASAGSGDPGGVLDRGVLDPRLSSPTVIGLDGKKYKRALAPGLNTGAKKKPPAPKPDPQPAVAEPQPAKLSTWYDGRTHEFDSWGDVYAALHDGCRDLGTVIATFTQAAYRVGRTVKIPVDEAEFMCGQVKDLRAALLVLLENRPSGDEILLQSDELDRRAAAIVADVFAELVDGGES